MSYWNTRFLGTHSIAAGAVLAATIAWSPLAVAAPDFGTSTTPSCKKGYYWSASKRKCVKRRSSHLSDQDRFIAGRQLALSGHYREALAILNTVANRQHAGVLTYLGYATRKMGRIDEGIGYYRQALALQPNNVKTREYLGEGYVSRGDLSAARDELKTIAEIAGSESPEFIKLAAVIAGTDDDASW